jgi:hypothetical protein
MKAFVHFLNGDNLELQNHYFQKEYRNDIVVEINRIYYEVFFFTKDSLEYEMRKDGFFSLPGIIILDEISNEKILNSVDYLVDIHYFDVFKGYTTLDFLSNRFANRWYENEALNFTFEHAYSYKLK